MKEKWDKCTATYNNKTKTKAKKKQVILSYICSDLRMIINSHNRASAIQCARPRKCEHKQRK